MQRGGLIGFVGGMAPLGSMFRYGRATGEAPAGGRHPISAP